MNTIKKLKEKIKNASQTLKKIGRVSGVETLISCTFVAAAVLLLADGQVVAALVSYGVACAAAWFGWLHYREHEAARAVVDNVAQVAAIHTLTPAKPKKRVRVKAKPAKTKPKAKPKKAK